MYRPTYSETKALGVAITTVAKDYVTSFSLSSSSSVATAVISGESLW